MTLSTELQKASQLAYNSGASLYRAVGVPVQIERYGTDCIGKMSQLMSSSGTANWQIIAAPERSFTHFAGLNEGHYYDPHLFMTEPLSIIGSDLTSTAKTLLKGCYVRLVSKVAEVLTIGYYRTGIIDPIHTYSYDTSKHYDLPIGRGYANTRLPFQIKFATNNGYLCTIRFGDISNPTLLTNDPVTTNEQTSGQYVIDALKAQYGVALPEVAEYFKNAAEISAYFTSLMRLEAQRRPSFQSS
ncbi:hypothetical protein KC660_00760 [Candidatus Dojkabacteria bacterium]|uniref:Uncharacterized protein n=1 Tax=Candidatus Dojkabacteria bacterium TaxID=2099670 RepID=A0A955L2Z4_9BACT|nr:hypothetical protein [Candidatus Dojkabacteria bacterium]